MTHELSPDPAPSHPRVPTLGEDPWFGRTAVWIARGGVALGLLSAAQTLEASWRSGWLDPALAPAGYTAVLHILAAPVRALGVWLARPLAPANAPVQAPALVPAVEPAAHDARSARAEEAAELRGRIRAEDWEGADALLAEIVARHGEDAQSERLRDDLAKAKSAAAARWRDLVAAAREAGDASRVLELYDQAPPGFAVDERETLDRELAGWFLELIHRRLRSGILQVDVVVLVDRASSAFAHTKEGASLRAALPTLRRGAGLCPRCGKPYVGYGEACPECSGKPEPPPPFIPELEPAEEPEVRAKRGDSEWFLDPEEGANGRPAG